MRPTVDKCDLDNRDLTCTWINTTVDVDPIELFVNAVENYHPRAKLLLLFAIHAAADKESYDDIIELNPGLKQEDPEEEQRQLECYLELFGTLKEALEE